MKCRGTPSSKGDIQIANTATCCNKGWNPSRRDGSGCGWGCGSCRGGWTCRTTAIRCRGSGACCGNGTNRGRESRRVDGLAHGGGENRSRNPCGRGGGGCCIPSASGCRSGWRSGECCPRWCCSRWGLPSWGWGGYRCCLSSGRGCSVAPRRGPRDRVGWSRRDRCGRRNGTGRSRRSGWSRGGRCGRCRECRRFRSRFGAGQGYYFAAHRRDRWRNNRFRSRGGNRAGGPLRSLFHSIAKGFRLVGIQTVQLVGNVRKT